MFLFFHSQQNDQNISYYKGKLFEQLLGKYLSAAGYLVTIRQKHNSLEYDLEGTHRVDGRKVVGEAKAYEATIKGEILSAFAGKLLPLGLAKNTVTGLFLATSALTAEADDYLRALEEYKINAYTGEDLLNQISDTLKLPRQTTVAQYIQGKGLFPLSSHLLTTDQGIYIIQLAATSYSAAPSSFALFREDGSILSDQPYLQLLTEKLPQLQALIPVFEPKPTYIIERVLTRGLTVGSEWADYRLPAAPSVFIGRRELAAHIENHILQGKEPNIIQVKSRSGVGKSSLLAYLDETLSTNDFIVELHDARDVKSVFDILSLVQRFCGEQRPASDMRGVEQQLATLAAKANGRTPVFMVDQFESTFFDKEVFNAYENIASIIMALRPKVYMIFSRKSDQLTTYDENYISLERLNNLSKSYDLHDFTVPEAAELIEKIGIAAAKPVTKEIKSYVLEFAQGFPWLIKRTMAHIVHLYDAGASQGELLTAGLRLDELFEEELEGLDEYEKDYLTRIAFRLPANIQQLQREFDEDPLLPKILDKLTRNRLIRLSGSTYDTYNDVFKEYLIYKKLPQFRQAFIYRISPSTVISTFHKLITKKKFTVEEMETDFLLPTGSAFNQIRELRALSLIRRLGYHWIIPQNVLDIYNRGSLGEYVRRQLMENGVVADLIANVGKNGYFEVSGLPIYLQQRFVFVNASKRTWEFYARILKTWVSNTKLLNIENDMLVLPLENRGDIIEDLGNLVNFAVKGPGLFLPSVRWNQVEEVALKVICGETVETKQEKKALTDLRSLELIGNNRAKYTSVAELKQMVKAQLSGEPYKRIWDGVYQGKHLTPIIIDIIGDGFSDITIEWRLKLILNWGKKLEIIPSDMMLKHKPSTKQKYETDKMNMNMFEGFDM